MSLNNAEIDLVLEELDLPGHSVRRVIQSDFRNVYLQLFRPPRAWWLRICLEHPRVRVHRCTRTPPGKRSHQRFEDFLHSRIKGGRIVTAEQIHRDRIVRFEILHNGVTTWIYLRLWGTRANIVVTDTSGTIIDVCFRKPREGLSSGNSFAPTPPECVSLREPRRVPAEESFNAVIERIYDEEERAAERTRLLNTVTKALDQKHRRLSARLEEITRGREHADDAERYRHQGELILSYLHRITPGDTFVDVEDYADENRAVRITLDREKSGAENAQIYFDKAKRAQESRQFLDTAADNLRTNLESLETRRERLPEISLEDLRQEAEEVRRTGSGRGKGRGNGAPGGAGGTDTAHARPGLEFLSHGFLLLVGRNARENDVLLRRYVRGNDWWLHTRDFAGGYVFIRSGKTGNVPLDVLLDAGNLAVFFSKARQNGSADLYYTRVKHLRRPRNGPVGLVLPTQEKNLLVQLDQDRLRKLGIGSDLNFR